MPEEIRVMNNENRFFLNKKLIYIPPKAKKKFDIFSFFHSKKHKNLTTKPDSNKKTIHQELDHILNKCDATGFNDTFAMTINKDYKKQNTYLSPTHRTKSDYPNRKEDANTLPFYTNYENLQTIKKFEQELLNSNQSYLRSEAGSLKKKKIAFFLDQKIT